MRKISKKHNLRYLTPFIFVSNSLRDIAKSINSPFYQVVKIKLEHPR